MRTIQVEAELSYEALLKAVIQLSSEELEKLQTELQEILARRRAPSLPEDETRLLLVINQPFPDAIEARYQELLRARAEEALTTEEHAELLRLSDQREEHWAARVAAAADLARIRGVPLPELMAELGLRPAHSDRQSPQSPLQRQPASPPGAGSRQQRVG